MERTRFRFRDDAEVIEADLIEATEAEWNALPESRDATWNVRRRGASVRAIQIDLPSGYGSVADTAGILARRPFPDS